MKVKQTSVVEWVDDGSGKVPVFFDRRFRLVDMLHDFIADVADRKRRERGSLRAYQSTVDSATYALLDWWRYLEDNRQVWLEVTDNVLEGYRDHAFKRVRNSPKGRKSDRTAKRTVNARLRWIYRFYCWAQEDTGLCRNLVGMNHPIFSKLPTYWRRDKGSSKKKRGDRGVLYPVCFPRVDGRGSGPQYFATSKDKRSILARFADISDPVLAERNRLIIELTDRVGWRSGTLRGLVIDDFNADAFERATDEGITVHPEVQKFNNDQGFLVPYTLAARIQRYIVLRSRWLAAHGWTEAHASRRLFLSARSGRPLGDKTISQLVGDAFRKIGVRAGMGAGHHSFRRKYSTESTADDIKARRALGLSTAAEDVGFATARRLGQKSIDSQAPYQRAVTSGLRDSEPLKMREQLRELESELADKDRVIADLKRKLK